MANEQDFQESNALQETLRALGQDFQESNALQTTLAALGQTQNSNSDGGGILKGTIPGFVPNSPTVPGNVVQNSLKVEEENLQNMLKTIQTVTDPGKKRIMLQDLQNSVGDLFQKHNEEARRQAESLIGIDKLTDNLRKNEELDRKHPLYQQYQSDSGTTARVRAQLLQAQQFVDGETKKILQSNGRLTSLMRNVDFTVKDTTRVLDQYDRTAEGAANLVAAVAPEVKDALFSIRPDLASNPLAAAEFIKNSYKDKQWGPLLQGEIAPDQYLTIAALGNPVAKILTVKKQAQATGMTEQQVAGQITAIQQFVAEPHASIQLIQEYKLIPDVKQFDAYRKLVNSPDKKDNAEAMAIRANLVDSLAGKMNQRVIDTNIAAWPRKPGEVNLSQLPEAKPIFEAYRINQNRVPTIQEFAKEFVNAEGLTPQQKADRKDLVTREYNQALSRMSNGIYGTKAVDNLGASTRLNASIMLEIGKRLARSASNEFSDPTELPQILPLGIAGGIAEQGVKQIVGGIGSGVANLFRGFTSR